MCPSYQWPLCSFERTWTPSCCFLPGYAYCVLIMGAGSLCFWQTLLQGGDDPSVSKVGNTHACLVTPLATVFPEAGVWSLGSLSRSQALPQASTQVSFPSHTTHYMCYVGIPIDHCPMSHILLGPIYCSRGLGSHCPHDWRHKAYQTQTGPPPAPLTLSQPPPLVLDLTWSHSRVRHDLDDSHRDNGTSKYKRTLLFWPYRYISLLGNCSTLPSYSMTSTLI